MLELKLRRQNTRTLGRLARFARRSRGQTGITVSTVAEPCGISNNLPNMKAPDRSSLWQALTGSSLKAS